MRAIGLIPATVLQGNDTEAPVVRAAWSLNAYNYIANRSMFESASRSAAYTIVLIATLFVLSIAAPHDAFARPTTGTAKAAHIELRAGTAAAPFGPASVITDFDADGAPDIAIADRTVRNGSHYTIEVRLSGGSTQTVSFLSNKGALRIAALDLDNDHDQDLIVTPVLSREVVGIWVNDGAGHFARGREAPYQSHVPALESGQTFSGSSLGLLPLVPGRRLQSLDLIHPTSVRGFDGDSSSLPQTDTPYPNEGFLSLTRSRGPPSPSC
jgi:FG-GAP-like repeat